MAFKPWYIACCFCYPKDCRYSVHTPCNFIQSAGFAVTCHPSVCCSFSTCFFFFFITWLIWLFQHSSSLSSCWQSTLSFLSLAEGNQCSSVNEVSSGPALCLFMVFNHRYIGLVCSSTATVFTYILSFLSQFVWKTKQMILWLLNPDWKHIFIVKVVKISCNYIPHLTHGCIKVVKMSCNYIIFHFYLVSSCFTESLLLSFVGRESWEEDMGIGIFLGYCCGSGPCSTDWVKILYHTFLFLGTSFP